MQVVGAFMVINVSLYDVEKYQVKWLRVLDYAERTWIRILCVRPNILFCPNFKGAVPNQLGLGLAQREPKSLNCPNPSNSSHFQKSTALFLSSLPRTVLCQGLTPNLGHVAQSHFLASCKIILPLILFLSMYTYVQGLLQ